LEVARSYHPFNTRLGKKICRIVSILIELIHIIKIYIIISFFVHHGSSTLVVCVV
jgi:hypothetical protein